MPETNGKPPSVPILEFLSRARTQGMIVILFCNALALVAKFMWKDIDLTQIIMMSLAPAVAVWSSGHGAEQERKKALTPKEGE